jgi:hypothetical protein
MIIIQTVNKFHRFIERRQTDMILTGKQFRDQILKLIGNEQPLAWAKKHKIKKEVMDTILKGSISDLPDLFKLSRALTYNH